MHLSGKLAYDINDFNNISPRFPTLWSYMS
jgi:hypothetical protein